MGFGVGELLRLRGYFCALRSFLPLPLPGFAGMGILHRECGIHVPVRAVGYPDRAEGSSRYCTLRKRDQWAKIAAGSVNSLTPSLKNLLNYYVLVHINKTQKQETNLT